MEYLTAPRRLGWHLGFYQEPQKAVLGERVLTTDQQQKHKNLMTDSTTAQFPKEELITTLSQIAEASKGDMAAIIKKLNIPVDLQSIEQETLKNHLQLAVSGDVQNMHTFAEKVEAASQDVKKRRLRATPKGGVTKFEAHWWGCELYISHDVIEKATDIAGLIQALSVLGGPELAAGATLLVGTSIAILRLADKGDGVIVTRYGWVSLPVPRPQ